jgi:hypothetical protein
VLMTYLPDARANPIHENDSPEHRSAYLAPQSGSS